MPFINNPTKIEKKILCFAIKEKNLLLKKDFSMLDFDDLLALKKIAADSDFFYEDTFSIASISLPPDFLTPETFTEISIREFFSLNDEEKNFLCARSRSILEWRKEYRFCSACGKSLVESNNFSARECPVCKKIVFPRVEPCVIVLVRRGKEALLVRHSYRNLNTFACIAGFMEAGESAEHAVRREVFEETGIKIKNIQYKGSQGWPYPDQLMLAFTAEYESGELLLQKEEIAEAIWCIPEECENTPKPGSVAYKLIHNLF